ncbi:dihydrofolate reductase [Microbacterium halophytorum]|uniref:dihydrofolate reductase n=1 Tax=Microbacterium halophytorum TaxID=2067568 RepID=UPI000CFA9842|nr:dihydrofolate reductase [Microbacterium halophytorum]
MVLRAIWAQTAAGVIGRDGVMPWHVPEDLAHFKRATLGAPVVMGRRTWESFPPRFRPLPGRENIVITRNTGFAAEGATVAGSLDEALERGSGGGAEPWVIGGGSVYAEAMPLLDELWVTEIDVDEPGDAFAPAIGPEWRLASSDPGTGWKTSEGGIRYRFLVYARRGTS